MKIIQKLPSPQGLLSLFLDSLFLSFAQKQNFFLSVWVTHDIMENEAESKAIEKKIKFSLESSTKFYY